MKTPPPNPLYAQLFSKLLAGAIGRALKQNYKCVKGTWWLFNGDVAARPLRQDEVEWHTLRRHAPFVKDGLTPNDPAYFEDPA